MILIGERINGLWRDIRRAIQNQDPGPIQNWAVKQAKAGAAYLDVNTGPAVDNPEEVMGWLVETVQEVVDLPISIDTTKIEAMEAGLKAHTKGQPLINSTTGEPKRLERVLSLAKEYDAAVIGLAMNEKGVPKDANDRVAIALEIVATADAMGIPMSDLYVDPLVLPCNVAQDHGPEVLETLRQVKLLADPAPNTVIGLSNISQKAKHRKLINRVFLVMAMSHGLDAAIVDACDEDLRDAVLTARILLNQEIYADSYLEIARREVE
jgi:5-methyltetrahydrofolate corrinoid/iron sulfur protein methyltransferase